MAPKKPKQYLGVREIAKLAHVSPSTVSRVINYPERTSDSVRERVNRIIQEYHYVPNQMAKNLFSQSSNSLAIFIHDFTNPFYGLLIQELGQIAFKNQYNLLICSTLHNKNQEIEYLNYCQAVRTKGIISIDNHPSNMYEHLHDSIKLVSFDCKVDSIHYSSVTSNNYQGIELLLNHLIQLGHRKIAFATVNSPTMQAAKLRRQAYQQLIGWHHNLPYREDYCQKFEGGSRATHSGKAIIDYFMNLPDPPTAILCNNDPMAIGTLMYAQSVGIRVPEDLSIAGFDGLTENFSYPRLTTVLQDYKKIAQILFDDVVDPSRSSEVHHDIVDVALSIGETTGPVKK